MNINLNFRYKGVINIGKKWEHFKVVMTHKKYVYEEYKKDYESLQFLENDIKEILTNIEYGKYTDNELLLEYKNLQAMRVMKKEKLRKINEKKKLFVEKGYFIH